MHATVQVAQAVTDALDGQTFSQEFTAQRMALPLFTLEEMQTLHVTVVPREVASNVLDRSRDENEIKVDVAVQKKVASAAIEEVDPLLSLVQEISDFLNRRSMGDAGWVKTENKPVYAPEHLREKQQFTSVLTLTYRVVRP
jgi:hypothetical protein